MNNVYDAVRLGMERAALTPGEEEGDYVDLDSLYGLAEAACDEVASLKSMGKFPLSDRVLLYIHEHFRNPALNLATLADEFVLTENYLSKLIKKIPERPMSHTSKS